jgi:hypothetical protein
VTALLAATQAMETVYTALKSQGSSAGMALPLMSFDGLTTLMGFPEVHDFERRWAERAAVSSLRNWSGSKAGHGEPDGAIDGMMDRQIRTSCHEDDI